MIGGDALPGLDADDPRPVSQQIAALLRTAIADNVLRPGDRLPSQSDLVERYGIARMTAAAVIDILEREQLVVSRRGSGVFVRTRTNRPVDLRSRIAAAFCSQHVTIDFASDSAALLCQALASLLDDIRAKRLAPKKMGLRLITGRANDRAPLGASAGDSATSLITEIQQLADLRLIRSATAEALALPLHLGFTLLILNRHDAFFGFATIDHPPIDKAAANHDLAESDATLLLLGTSDDRPHYVAEATRWFESTLTAARCLRD